jgi:hypothetical protein
VVAMAGDGINDASSPPALMWGNNMGNQPT